MTVVALGDTGVKVRQTDAYVAGKAWYRTDVDCVNAPRAKPPRSTARRAARSDEASPLAARRGHGDGRVRRRMTAARRVAAADRRRAARRGRRQGVLGRIAAGQPLADTCACGAQPDPAAAIGWPVEAGKGDAARGSLAAFGPDGSIPLDASTQGRQGRGPAARRQRVHGHAAQRQRGREDPFARSRRPRGGVGVTPGLRPAA